MLKQVYLALKARLGDIVDVEEIDWYLGQYLQDEEGSVLYVGKALYLEFMPIPWNTLPRGVQKAVLVFKVHAVTECIYEDEQRITDPVVDHLQFVTDVFKLLINYRIKDGQNNVLLESIVRNETAPDHELEGVLATVQEFQAVMYDYNALPSYVETTIQDIEITPTIVESI